MFLKIVLLLIIIYLIYRAFGGSISLPKKEAKKDVEDGDTLVECCECGVYITKKEAKIKMGKYYCDECA